MNMEKRRSLRGVWLGRRPYLPVLELQQKLHAARRDGAIDDVVLLLEHEPVITLGRGAKAEHLLLSTEALRERGVDVVETGRGGDVTLHAPGQLVAYPIVDLSPDRQDVRRYVRDLSEVMRRIAGRYGVSGGRIDEYIGLWVDADHPENWPGEEHVSRPVKLGAIGVRISRWVTMHGFALNLSTDLSLFQLIVPCGIRELGVAALENFGHGAPSTRRAAELAHAELSEILGRTPCDLEDCSALNEADLGSALLPGVLAAR